MTNRRILVLDGESRTALAVTRSLGKLGYELGIVSESSAPLTAGSKYASLLFPLPKPRQDPAAYIAALAELIATWKPLMLIPLTDLSLHLCLLNKKTFGASTCLPTVSFETFQTAVNKHALLELAAALDIRTPKTLLIPGFSERNPEDIRRVKEFQYPAVLKPQSTESALGESFHRPQVYYPKNADEALSLVSVSTVSANSRIPFLLQERIIGAGIGVFALCYGGKPAATFCHRRLLEKPPSGGVSVLSESVPEKDAPVKETLQLLEALKWDGVAMVEFKQHADGQFYLMEINPRLWGSLQLAIDAGRDFPALLVSLFTDPNPEKKAEEMYRGLPPYRDVRLRWAGGTLEHAFMRLRQEPIRALADIVLGNSLQFFHPGAPTRLEIFRKEDPGPVLYQVKEYIAGVFAGLGIQKRRTESADRSLLSDSAFRKPPTAV